MDNTRVETIVFERPSLPQYGWLGALTIFDADLTVASTGQLAGGFRARARDNQPIHSDPQFAFFFSGLAFAPELTTASTQQLADSFRSLGRDTRSRETDAQIAFLSQIAEFAPELTTASIQQLADSFRRSGGRDTRTIQTDPLFNFLFTPPVAFASELTVPSIQQLWGSFRARPADKRPPRFGETFVIPTNLFEFVDPALVAPSAGGMLRQSFRVRSRPHVRDPILTQPQLAFWSETLPTFFAELVVPGTSQLWSSFRAEPQFKAPTQVPAQIAIFGEANDLVLIITVTPSTGTGIARFAAESLGVAGMTTETIAVPGLGSERLSVNAD